jgi:hypothetical protein
MLARFCRPSRPVLLFSNVPGATRFALAPGYHLAAPAALHREKPNLRRHPDRQFLSLNSRVCYNLALFEKFRKYS